MQAGIRVFYAARFSLYNTCTADGRIPTMQRIIKLAIVIFWAIMASVLVRRNLPEPQPPAPTLPSLASAPALTTQPKQEEWMGIYHQDHKVGYLQRQLSPTATGYQWEEVWRLRLRFLDTPQTIHTEIRADTDRSFALTGFDFRLLSSGLTFHANGKVSNHKLDGQMTTGGETSPFAFPLQSPIYLPATTQMTLRGAPLQAGEERQFNIFNPLSMRTDPITVVVVGPDTLTIKGKQHDTTKVRERFGDTTMYAWLDAEGKVVKEEAALGLVLLRESQQDALGGGWQEQGSLDLTTSAAIPVQHPLPHPRTLTSLRLRLSSADDSLRFSFPPRQQHQDQVLTIAQEALPSLLTYQLPQTDPSFAEDLAPTPFLQSAHPRLVTQMQQILGPERDALHVTRYLLNWTYSTIEKTPTVGLPTALEVLDSKRGDCNEHAVLFTALARAAGLPARIAAGVVYLDGAFYYHAWSEVWLGQWVAVDPTFQQFPADATHVKFVEGGPEQHMALLKTIGQIKLEVMEYR
ncbi:MAG: transglutaminase domain-containing protein [Deltaproteobacteria bacterium]|nr:transglutaminase domain-containing protein [Deltaproteobacteria bacterium]